MTEDAINSGCHKWKWKSKRESSLETSFSVTYNCVLSGYKLTKEKSTRIKHVGKQLKIVLPELAQARPVSGIQTPASEM